MMIEPGWKVYQGMIVGEHNRENDLEVNVLKGKKLTNIRTTSKDEAVRLTPPIRMTLEKSLAWIQDDELVEVTPKSIRIRKTRARPERAQARRALGQGKRRRLTVVEDPSPCGEARKGLLREAFCLSALGFARLPLLRVRALRVGRILASAG